MGKVVYIDYYELKTQATDEQTCYCFMVNVYFIKFIYLFFVVCEM